MYIVVYIYIYILYLFSLYICSYVYSLHMCDIHFLYLFGTHEKKPLLRKRQSTVASLQPGGFLTQGNAGGLHISDTGPV